MSAPVVALVALAVTVALTPVAMAAARRLDILDRPGELKSQTAPVPYLGGVAVFAGTAVGALSARSTVLIPLSLALVLGVADDRLDLPPWVRLIGQGGVGVAVAITCPLPVDGIVALLATVAVTVVVVNGVNLLDGLDMLASGVVGVAAVGFSLVLTGPGRLVAVATAGALVGFLAFNRPPARIYLGDGGSYLLGTALTVLLALAFAPHSPSPTGAACVLLVAVPVLELGLAVLRRLRARRSPLAGDRRHPYDCLVVRGWSTTATSLAYVAVAVLLGAAAVVAAHHASLGTVIVVDLVGSAVALALALATGTLSTPQDAPS